MNFTSKLDVKLQEMMNASDPIDRKQIQFNAEITAEEMKKIIKMNYKGNRDLHRPTFRKYVRAMNLNRWILSPEPLVFVKQGTEWVMIDGNHRSNAQIEAGTTNRYSVAIVDSIDRYKYLDQGKVRTNADIIGAHIHIVYPIQYLLRASSFISYPMPEDVEAVLKSRIGELLSEVEYEIKPPRKSGSIWKQTAFKAAFVMAIMTNRISYEDAYDVYDSLSHGDLKEWPDVFVQLYRQIMEGSISVNRSGKSLDNDYFMRGVFAFEHYHNEGKTLAIHNNFRNSVKEDVFEVMKQFTPIEEGVAS
jgi:hypothetical protein